MRKIGVVIKQTYLRQVKSWSFVALILTPFIFLLLMFGISYLSVGNATENDALAVVASSATQRQATVKALKTQQVKLNRRYTTRPQAKQALKNDKISGYVVAQTKAQQVQFQYYGTTALSKRTKNQLLAAAVQKQQALNFNAAALTPKQAAALSRAPSFKQHVINTSVDKNKTIKLISFMLLLFMMYFILLTYTATTAQEIASEKGTKIMEVIFSSTKAENYFYGKITGILLVMLTQLLIYGVGGMAIYALTPKIKLLADFLKQHQTLIDGVLHHLLSFNLVYVVLGVLIYTVLAALCGALVTRPEDATKATQPAMYLIMIGFLGALALNQAPNNFFVKLFSYIPFLSSFFMPIRLINQTVSAWGNFASMGILVLATCGLTFYISHIYSGLVLQTDEMGLLKSFRRGITIK